MISGVLTYPIGLVVPSLTFARAMASDRLRQMHELVRAQTHRLEVRPAVEPNAKSAGGLATVGPVGSQAASLIPTKARLAPADEGPLPHIHSPAPASQSAIALFFVLAACFLIGPSPGARIAFGGRYFARRGPRHKLSRLDSLQAISVDSRGVAAI